MSGNRLLDQLNATPAQIGPLAYNSVRHIVAFLLRWQAYDEAQAVIDAWHSDTRVTVQEFRAQALLGRGLGDAAIALMQKRMAQKEPGVVASVLYGRLLLGAGRIAEARDLAAQLTQASPEYGPAWGLQGDVCLAAGGVDEAADAFRRYRALSPNARPPLIGLARVALLQQDGVAADAFAVQAIEEGGIDSGPSADILRAAEEIFAAVPDVVRQDEVQLLLARRFEDELEAARAVLEVRAPHSGATKGRASPNASGQCLSRQNCPSHRQ